MHDRISTIFTKATIFSLDEFLRSKGTIMYSKPVGEKSFSINLLPRLLSIERYIYICIHTYTHMCARRRLRGFSFMPDEIRVKSRSLVKNQLEKSFSYLPLQRFFCARQYIDNWKNTGNFSIYSLFIPQLHKFPKVLETFARNSNI